MKAVARAPGKLAILGEYAVLDGGEALVMAVARHCVAEISFGGGGESSVTVAMPRASRHVPGADGTTGVAVVDLLAARWGPLPRAPAWTAMLDSRDFWSGGGKKLGLGSSAAALCAWAGAREAAARAGGAPSRLSLEGLVELHRELQGGVGSGLDVAASFAGGVLGFRLDADSVPRIGSVHLPNGVAFAGVFAGASASTPDFVGRYRAWQAAEPQAASDWLGEAEDAARAGSHAIREGDAAGFLAAIQQYGRALESLGERLASDVVTAEHRGIGERAAEFGLAYKVSGAGGGDVGLVMGTDGDALGAFRREVAALGFEWIDLQLDEQGLVIETREEKGGRRE